MKVSWPTYKSTRHLGSSAALTVPSFVIGAGSGVMSGPSSIWFWSSSTGCYDFKAWCTISGNSKNCSVSVNNQREDGIKMMFNQSSPFGNRKSLMLNLSHFLQNPLYEYLTLWKIFSEFHFLAFFILIIFYQFSFFSYLPVSAICPVLSNSKRNKKAVLYLAWPQLIGPMNLANLVLVDTTLFGHSRIQSGNFRFLFILNSFCRSQKF